MDTSLNRPIVCATCNRVEQQQHL